MRRSLAWILVGVAIAGCAAPAGASPTSPVAVVSSEPSVSPPPLATPAPTGEPTMSPATGPVLPTTEPTGPTWTPRPAEKLLVESLVYVLADRLNVRARPTVDSKILGVVEKGDYLVTGAYGPFSRDGYAWYHAVFLARAGEPPRLSVDVHNPGGELLGWIAAAKGSTRYVGQLRPRCAQVIDVSNIRYMLGSELLACFGSNTIELTGTFGCSGCGGALLGTFEPTWLAHPLNANFISDYPIGDQLGPLVLHFPPGGPERPPVASVIRVRGHFDDPAAATCEISVVDPLHPNGEQLVAIPSEAAQLVCAQQFVVETLEVLGTDPGFRFG